MGFISAVYDAVKQIPAGKVASYGQIARLAGNPRMARQVGWAMHACPADENIPCHRVLNRLGECCKGFAFGGEDIQRALLEGEGVVFGADGRVDMAAFGWEGE